MFNHRGFNVAIKIKHEDARLVVFTLVFCRFFLRLVLRFQRFLVEQFRVEALALLFVMFVERTDDHLVIVVAMTAFARRRSGNDQQDTKRYGQRLGEKQSVIKKERHHQVFRFQNRGIRVANNSRCITAKTSVCILAMPR